AVFFFQAEDGIRDFHVTGVQTCALPISLEHDRAELALAVSAGVVGVGGVLAHQCGHGRLLRVEADAVVEGGDVDGPPASYLGGADGAHAAPVADGVDGAARAGGGVGGGDGGHRHPLSVPLCVCMNIIHECMGFIQ